MIMIHSETATSISLSFLQWRPRDRKNVETEWVVGIMQGEKGIFSKALWRVNIKSINLDYGLANPGISAKISKKTEDDNN